MTENTYQLFPSKYPGLSFQMKPVESGDIFIGKITGSLFMAFPYASLFQDKVDQPCLVLNKVDRSKVKEEWFL